MSVVEEKFEIVSDEITLHYRLGHSECGVDKSVVLKTVDTDTIRRVVRAIAGEYMEGEKTRLTSFYVSRDIVARYDGVELKNKVDKSRAIFPEAFVGREVPVERLEEIYPGFLSRSPGTTFTHAIETGLGELIASFPGTRLYSLDAGRLVNLSSGPR